MNADERRRQTRTPPPAEGRTDGGCGFLPPREKKNPRRRALGLSTAETPDGGPAATTSCQPDGISPHSRSKAHGSSISRCIRAVHLMRTHAPGFCRSGSTQWVAASRPPEGAMIQDAGKYSGSARDCKPNSAHQMEKRKTAQNVRVFPVCA